MRAEWTQRLARSVVGWHPRRWRDRYAEEVLDVLDQHRITTRTVVNLAANAAAARLDPTYRAERSALMHRLRAGLAVFAAVAVFLGLTVGWRLIVGEETDFGMIGAHDAAFSADGRLVATTSGAATVRLWDATRPNQPVRLSSFDGGIHVALTPDGHTVAVLGGFVELWNVTDPTHPTRAHRFPRYPQDVAGIALSLDGRTLAVGYHDTIILYDITDPAHPRELTPLPAHPTKAPAHASMDMRFAPDGRTLATAGGTTNTVRLWTIVDPSHPTVIATLPAQKHHGVTATQGEGMAFTADSTTLATASHDGYVQLWNITDPAHPALTSTVDDTATTGGYMGVSDNAMAVAFTPDSRTLITVMGNEKATAWDITDPTRVTHLHDLIRTGAGPGKFRISPDAHTVVSAAHASDTVNLWPIP